MAVKQTPARRTLEEVLAEKTDVDAAVTADVRAAMKAIGIRIGAIA